MSDETVVEKVKETGVSKSFEKMEAILKEKDKRIVLLEKQRDWVIVDFAKSLFFHNPKRTENEHQTTIRKLMEEATLE